MAGHCSCCSGEHLSKHRVHMLAKSKQSGSLSNKFIDLDARRSEIGYEPKRISSDRVTLPPCNSPISQGESVKLITGNVDESQCVGGRDFDNINVAKQSHCQVDGLEPSAVKQGLHEHPAITEFLMRLIPADLDEPAVDIEPPSDSLTMRTAVLAIIGCSASAPLFSEKVKGVGEVYWALQAGSQPNERAIRKTGVSDLSGDVIVVYQASSEKPVRLLDSVALPPVTSDAAGLAPSHREATKPASSGDLQAPLLDSGSRSQPGSNTAFNKHPGPGRSHSCALPAFQLSDSATQSPSFSGPNAKMASRSGDFTVLDCIASREGGVIDLISWEQSASPLAGSCAVALGGQVGQLSRTQLPHPPIPVQDGKGINEQRQCMEISPCTAGDYISEGCPGSLAVASTERCVAQECTVESLPSSILQIIFGFLNFGDLSSCASVCHLWRGDIGGDEELLRKLSIRRRCVRLRPDGMPSPLATPRPEKWGRKLSSSLPLPFVLLQAAEAGNLAAMVLVAKEFLVRGQKIRGLDWCRRAARRGHQESQYHLGEAYYRGEDDWPRDEEEALAWLLRAVKNPQGDPHIRASASLLIGYMYLDGEGIQRADNTEAVKWLKTASLMGSKEAEQTVGWLWKTGQY